MCRNIRYLRDSSVLCLDCRMLNEGEQLILVRQTGGSCSVPTRDSFIFLLRFRATMTNFHRTAAVMKPESRNAHSHRMISSVIGRMVGDFW